MADFVEYKNEGVWQHFLREKGATKLRNCLHDKTHSAFFVQHMSVYEKVLVRLLKITCEDRHLAVVEVLCYIACLLTIELTLTLITFGMIRFRFLGTAFVLCLVNCFNQYSRYTAAIVSIIS